MKTFIAAIAVGAAMFAAPAFADTMQNTYGNTIVVTYASGAVAHYHFNADGTFSGVAPGGSHMAGRYTAEGDQLCLIPPSGQAPQCTQIQTDKNIGDTWTQLGADGSQITVELRAGREEHAH
ncbi:MAG: hypothetical protein JNL81_10940 [Hyphomonadaceae bacterium]|nr:hypothetical protein [Hyphomonadaceae bacterium]